jgi:hypothetical protein
VGLLAWTQAAAAGSLGLGVAIWIYEEVLA